MFESEKNIVFLWILNCCRASWFTVGTTISYFSDEAGSTMRTVNQLPPKGTRSDSVLLTQESQVCYLNLQLVFRQPVLKLNWGNYQTALIWQGFKWVCTISFLRSCLLTYKRFINIFYTPEHNIQTRYL